MSTNKAPGPTALPPSPRLRLVLPIERFLRLEAASGILLVAAAVVALLWANSPWGESYLRLWQTPVGIRVGSRPFEGTLRWFVNDCLMVLFFFSVGLEIRREVQHGELSAWRKAALPALAALGGMLAPAAVYLVFAGAPATRAGWGVPMATDIAFAIGILTLLGKRVPAALRVLLLALAVIDDLGAIVVIAVFYAAGVTLPGFLSAAAGLGGVFALQRLGVRAKLAYLAPSVLVWAGVYAAGIHPTIAGVVLGLVTPGHAWPGVDRSPAESLIETLTPWVAFAIMPVFALANAGVSLSGVSLEAASCSVFAGIAGGLVIGKPVGVLLACWLTLRLRLGILPLGIGVRHLVVLAVVAGVGFTMSLFVAQLAFRDEALLGAAKLGVLVGSGAAAVVGLAVGRLLLVPGSTKA